MEEHMQRTLDCVLKLEVGQTHEFNSFEGCCAQITRTSFDYYELFETMFHGTKVEYYGTFSKPNLIDAVRVGYEEMVIC